METYFLHHGTSPVFVSLPHDGTALPDEVAARLTHSARRLPDTDWHVSRLYAFARELGASMIVPVYSRYVVDLNRAPDDVSLYPGQNTTGICPLVQFSGEPVYLPGQGPSPDESKVRIESYWRPYHDALNSEILRIKAEHRHVILWEGHSIRSVVPFLFEGRLPDFNLGTVGGISCTAGLQRKLVNELKSQSKYSAIVNGRFKGGYITRHYGQPIDRVNAIQLELAQCTYMDEDNFEYRESLALPTQALIQRLLEICLES